MDSLEIDSKSPKASIRRVSRRKTAFIIVAVILVAVAAIVVGTVFTKRAHRYSFSGKGKRSSGGCSSFKSPVVILVSMDGFRSDYFERNLSPNIKKLADEGVRAKYMKSQFPTKTFPNHYTIATGLYPESHGIVSNSFKNEKRTDSFRIGGKTANDAKWWHGEPIWVTARKQGLKSATYFWVGSEASVQGIRPNYWKHYNGRVAYEKRVDQVLSWLDMNPSERPSFLSLYFEEPDKQGHRQGTTSSQVNNAIKRVDDMIGRLMDGIKIRKLSSCINIVLVSDHGMADVSCSRVIYLDKFLDLSNISVVGQGAMSLFYLKNNSNLEGVVKSLECKHKNLRAYGKQSPKMPKRIHYANSKRIGDVVLIADSGWTILRRNGSCSSYYKGSHGYDNYNHDMRALFVAHGPSFKKGIVIPPFSNIEVYNMLCELLNLKPAPNNGTDGSLSNMLLNPSKRSSTKTNGDGNDFSTTCDSISNINRGPNNCSQCFFCSDCDNEMKKNFTRHGLRRNLSESEVKSSWKVHFPWGVPQGGAGNGGCLLTQKYYVTGYSGYLHIPLWVGYKLTSKQIDNTKIIKTCFFNDDRLKVNQSASCDDYNSTQYQRMQLAPVDYFKFDDMAIQDTYLLSNVVPQSKHFSQDPGLWYKLETLVRQWAVKYNPVYVISGSIFDDDDDGKRDKDTKIKRWLSNKELSVAVPTHFYKIIVRYKKDQQSNDDIEALAFVLPHNISPECQIYDWQIRLQEYIVSINDIEKMTGITFFKNLPISNSATFKSQVPSDLWT